MGNGLIVTRRVAGGFANNQIGDDLRQLRNQGQAPTLLKAVVVEVICDPSSYTEEELQALAERVNNPEYVDIMPINSVVARITSNSQDAGNPTEIILFPFFSSNFLLPIAPGEQIYVIYEDYSFQRSLMGFWLTRISEQRTVEDVNYTHGDRRYQGFLNPQNIGTDQRGNQTVITQSFPNGGNNEGNYTLRITGSNNENPYDGILAGSKAAKFFTFEPVPRFKKRPGDFVLQGKNNSLIILGTDRIGSITSSLGTTQAGCIDMVAGRSRVLPEGDGPSQSTTSPNGTSPWITRNSRGHREVNKSPYVYEGNQDAQNEGNPDLINDAARLLITMQSNADINFGIVDNPNVTYATDTLPIIQPNPTLSGTFGKSYVFGKADNIRFIARNNTDLNISGSLLLMREGTTEENIGYFFINNEANIQIMAPKIYFGKATGQSTNNEPPEPYIKWTEFKKTIDHLQTEIENVRSALQSQLDAINTNFGTLTSTLNGAFASSIAIPYSPISSLAATAGAITSTGTSINGAVQSGDSQAQQAVSDGKSNTNTSVEESKSERIFGE